MKKIFIAAGILLVANSMSFAQASTVAKKEARTEKKQAQKAEVSYQTKEKFAADFPDAKEIQYTRGTQFDEVSFTKNNKTEKAYYDNEAQLVGTTQKKSFSDLPESAQKNILKDYKDYTVARVIEFDDNQDNDSDMYLYGYAFEDADNYFVELKNPNKAIVLKVEKSGGVSYFTTMR